MLSYNYLSNELPRELIEVYNDLQSDVLKIITNGLKNKKEPSKVFAEIQLKIGEYNPDIEKIVAIIFKDSEYKTYKSNKKAFKEGETEDIKEIPMYENDALITPFFVGAIDMTKSLNNKLLSNAVNRYTQHYSIIKFDDSLSNMQNAYKDLIKNGVSIYESFGGGKSKNYSVENILRRDVMSLVNKSNATINKENFKKSSAKFIEVSSHPTARTGSPYMKHAYEDHSSWQGKVYYSKDGEKVEGYLEFESTCGFGQMLGIGGVNCYHLFELNYDGESSATEYDQQEVERLYKLSQKQRAYERAIRKLKQAKAVWEEVGDDNLLKQTEMRLKMANNRLKQFCNENNLRYYSSRTKF